MSRVRIAVALVVSFASASTIAEPARTTTSVRWRGATGSCSAPSALTARVSTHTWRARVHADGGQLLAEGHFERSPRGLRALLRLRDRRGTVLGQRTLGPMPSCAQLEEQVVLVMAMMIDAHADAVPRAAGEVGAANDVARPTGDITSGSIDERPPRRATHPAVLVIGLQHRIGPQPGSALAIATDLHLPLPGRWQLATGLWATEQVRVDVAGSAATVRTAGATVRACAAMTRAAAVALTACGGMEVGLTAALGAGFVANHRVISPTASTVLSAQLGAPIGGRWRIVAAVTGGVPVLAPRLVYQDDSGAMVVLSEAPRLIGSAALGVGIDFR